MDELRLDANEQEIDEYYENLEEAAEGIPFQFIFNIDECGMQDWMDAREQRAIVPKDYDKQTAPFVVSRNGKLATALHCIAGDGSWVNSQIVLQRLTGD